MLNQLKGQTTERLALKYLRQHNLRLIAQNVRCKLGEIDLVMLDQSDIQARILVFVEVRYRERQAYGGAAASINHHKQQRIIRTAQWFRQRHKHYLQYPCRFDVMALSGPLPSPQIQWIPAAFG